MEKRRIGWVLAGIVGLLMVALAAVELPARFEPPTPPRSADHRVDHPSGVLTSVPPQEGQPETGGGLVPITSELLEPPPPPPGPPEDEEESDGEGDDEEETTTTVVERHTIWKILFPYETLGESIRAALGEMVLEGARDIGGQVRDGISGLTRSVIGDTDLTRGIRDVRQDVWRVGIVIAGILMPLSFMSSVVTAMKDGTSSITGYASAREALINWVIAAGAAVSSYFILTKAIELSAAGMSAIFSGLLGTASSNFSLGDYFNGILLETAFMSNPGIAQIFLAIFGMLLALALLMSIGLALLAREVILILAVGVAPVMLVMGSVGPLRWLNGLWMKVTTIALLLGPANAFLIGSSALLALNAHQSDMNLTGIGGRILGFLVALGIISVLIGLNTIIGKMVYGAAIEIAEKALNGIMVAAGAVLAPAAMGLVGGAGVAATSAGSAAAGGAASTAGIAGTATQASSAARAVGAIGQAASAMGLPGARGFSAGLNAGSALTAHNQIKQGIAEAADMRAGRSQEEPWDNKQLDLGKAVDTAAGGVHGEINQSGMKGVLGSRGISPENARDRTEAAKQTARNMGVVGERHGVNMLKGYRQLGVAGRVAQDAAIDYNRSAIKTLAFGSPSPFHPQPYSSLPRELTARDMDTAMQIVRPVGMDHIPGVGLLDNLAQTAYQRRIQLNEDPLETIRQAGKAANLEDWMKSSYTKLPDRGLAEDLRRGLGI